MEWTKQRFHLSPVGTDSLLICHKKWCARFEEIVTLFARHFRREGLKDLLDVLYETLTDLDRIVIQQLHQVRLEELVRVLSKQVTQLVEPGGHALPNLRALVSAERLQHWLQLLSILRVFEGGDNSRKIECAFLSKRFVGALGQRDVDHDQELRVAATTTPQRVSCVPK